MGKDKLKKIFLTLLLVLASFIILLYFLGSEQLKYRQSSGNINLPEADSISSELNNECIIEQSFTNKIEIIDELGIVFTKFYKPASGNVEVAILQDNTLLRKENIDIADIEEQVPYSIYFSEPIEDQINKNLTIRITADTTDALAVMMNNKTPGNVNVNGIKTLGTLCFYLNGRDHILIGNYYWLIMSVIFMIFALYEFLSYQNYLRGKNNIFILAILAINRYSFLIKQLVSRDFKSKYKRSVLGIIWSFLNPLLTMTVQFLVFSTIFKANTQSYPVYLLSGVICFNFFKETTDMCLTSISGNANLINKVYIPKYIFPFSRTISSSINLAISLVPLVLVCLIMRVCLSFQSILGLYFLFCLIIFAMGIGMILASLMVFFRDLQFLWGVLSQIWMYATPIFYTAEIIPDKFKFIVRFNPLYHFIGNFRKCLMDGVSPEPKAYIYCLLFALMSIIVGYQVFKKTQDQFTLYL